MGQSQCLILDGIYPTLDTSPTSRVRSRWKTQPPRREPLLIASSSRESPARLSLGLLPAQGTPDGCLQNMPLRLVHEERKIQKWGKKFPLTSCFPPFTNKEPEAQREWVFPSQLVSLVLECSLGTARQLPTTRNEKKNFF